MLTLYCFSISCHEDLQAEFYTADARPSAGIFRNRSNAWFKKPLWALRRSIRELLGLQWLGVRSVTNSWHAWHRLTSRHKTRSRHLVTSWHVSRGSWHPAVAVGGTGPAAWPPAPPDQWPRLQITTNFAFVFPSAGRSCCCGIFLAWPATIYANVSDDSDGGMLVPGWWNVTQGGGGGGSWWWWIQDSIREAINWTMLIQSAPAPPPGGIFFVTSSHQPAPASATWMPEPG